MRQGERKKERSSQHTKSNIVKTKKARTTPLRAEDLAPNAKRERERERERVARAGGLKGKGERGRVFLVFLEAQGAMILYSSCFPACCFPKREREKEFFFYTRRCLERERVKNGAKKERRNKNKDDAVGVRENQKVGVFFEES